MLYFKSEFVSVFWDDEPQCVHTEWHGFATKHNLKGGLLKAIELAKKKGATRWLADLRDMHVYDLKDQEWIIKEFVPLLRLAGISKIAFIKPLLPVTMMSVTRLINTCDPKREQTELFDNLQSAYSWLTTRQPAKVATPSHSKPPKQ
ncbi:MAG: hypothetical protein Q8K75_00365 [Chlamydiales bacterium]|nr:hypothetical protein [Chlamydiales bacterium]